jgi:hypothetical protein
MKASRLALVVISSLVLEAAQEQSPLESVKADRDGCWIPTLVRHFGASLVQLMRK